MYCERMMLTLKFIDENRMKESENTQVKKTLSFHSYISQYIKYISWL